jgi:hypothetical protein
MEVNDNEDQSKYQPLLNKFLFNLTSALSARMNLGFPHYKLVLYLEYYRYERFEN